MIAREPCALSMCFNRYVGFASQNRFNASGFAGVVEVFNPKEIAMICDGTGAHSEFFSAFDKLFDLAGAVEERIRSVEVKVYEIHSRSGRQGLKKGEGYLTGGVAGRMAHVSCRRVHRLIIVWSASAVSCAIRGKEK